MWSLFGLKDKDYKQVIVVRVDLKMGKGKLASQVAHASLCAFLNSKKKIRKAWLKKGAAKIVLKVNSKDELLEVYKKAKSKNLPVCLIQDAARTQLKHPDYTALGIGPAETYKIDEVTSKLKLL